jgi:hypothetical protein
MSSGPKETFESLTWSNRFGALTLGSLNLSGQGGLESDVLSGIGLQAFNSLHYVQMENDGPRKGWTLQRNPGVWEVKCGDSVKEGDIGGYVQVENGDLVLKAPNGRIRLQAVDIDIRADGYNQKTGVINIDANAGEVFISANKVKVKSQDGISLFSPQAIDIVSNTAMNLASNFVGGFTSAAAQLGAKALPVTNQVFETVNRFV